MSAKTIIRAQNDAPALSESVGETFLATLKQKGVDYLFINSGTDAAPIAEAYARQHLSGLEFPTPVIGTHENLVVGMAHGYTMVTGKIQAVMVHVSVGAANAVCGVMNARRDEIPMLFMAGRTPLFEKGPLGARSGAIHWAQEMYDQAGMLRELVKWDYELRSGINVDDVLDRGLSLAQAAPAGPVYLTLPREVLAEETPPAPVSSQALPVPATPAPAPADIEALAALIEASRCPIIVTSASGRDPTTVAPLAALAERFGLGIVEAKSRYVCAPSDHPYHLGQSVHPWLGDADLLICLESEVPWLPGTREPRPETRIVHIGVDPLFRDYPIRSFRGERFITSSAANILTPLHAALEVAASAEDVAARKTAIAGLAATRAERRAKRLAPLLAEPRMNKDWLNHCLNEALPDDAIVVNEYWVDREIYDAKRAGGFFMHSPAAGLGWGMPAAVGAALAAPDQPVVCTLGDGAYLFGNPGSCHQAIAMHEAPLLTILCNNARWGAVQASTIGVYPEGHAARGPKPAPLSDLHPVPDFEKYAEASGGHGEKVTDPKALPDAIRRALKIIREERRQVLLNVICE
ncbi:thiamine pyrophosphate-requiring protein [Brevundimonas diminuta]|uniref:thiamine pyrophosphate-requiring protein n=1 Tax=Brevundimonas diminuta TaxID=293 RepID=UPI0020973923|nr:thiamine pyrophosphate-requiring protein [Brevundimonas diminuta]MCO8019179.1 thiamine pyrophosphate-requiring protein [Brevundimonas diminuta]MCO8021856.1 thiamine pyrophosphate-requiring protein [Brevundimonas diminuta]